MKKLLLLALILTLSDIGFCQNVLFLKNGDKINGSLSGFKNDSIIFNAQGNKLKFKTSSITSIYFDDKAIFNDLNKTITNETKPTQEGKIFGVVTYFFNDNYGYKPDVGAGIYVIDSIKSPYFKPKTIDSIQIGSNYRYLYLSYPKRSIPIDVLKNAENYNVINEASYEALDKRALEIILTMEVFDKNLFKTIADGSGNYSIKVKPGTYYVCIKSSNRTGLSTTESNGKVYYKKVIIEEGSEINLNCKFGLHYQEQY
jgi:hypothetical protein